MEEDRAKKVMLRVEADFKFSDGQVRQVASGKCV
jgi:hypothetical protein